MTETPEEQAIKPCPCCGNKAEHEELDEPKSSPNWGGEIIACSHCGLATAVVFSCKEPAITELLRLWNRRAAEAAAREEERKRCKKDACCYCNGCDASVSSVPIRLSSGAWIHRTVDESDYDMGPYCKARNIWDREAIRALAGEEKERT